MQINPLWDNVLIKPLEKKETKSGIVLPNNNKSPSRGTVAEIGGDVTRVQVGDNVIIAPFGDEIEGFICIKEQDIVATYEDTE